MTAATGNETRYGRPCPLLQLTLISLFFLAPAWSGGSAAASSQHALKIIAFGDSLTAGFGLAAEDSFPAKLEKALRAEGYPVTVINAGVSAATASDGLSRLDWTIAGGADGVILELGANDMLRGFDPELTETVLGDILAKLTERGVPVLIAGMKAPHNLGADYQMKFDGIYPALAKKYGAPLYPFFLEGVVDRPELELADGIHPNPAGVEIMVKNILPSVRAFLASLAENAAKR